jgi:hypothetical protein
MRSLLAQLSPNEENTLRRIARGTHGPLEDHVAKLKRLALVEEINGALRLTDVGIQRHANLDRPEKRIANTAPAAESLPARRHG